MFLQIHFLTSYHATLLNRDDAGLAKRINLGGVTRLRVSSQCQKRHWREWMLERTDLPRGYRTRHFFNRIVKKKVVEKGIDPELAHELIWHLGKTLLTAAGDKDALDKETLAMKQPVLFGNPEANFFVRLIEEAAQSEDVKKAQELITERLSKKNAKALMEQAGLDDPAAGFEGALFGRFVTSDILARVDAPVHVAHAFTTHALDTEVDFFTVVDDLAGDETGAAHANDMELGTGIYYGYVVVDVPLLMSNLTGCQRSEWLDQDPSDARKLLELLIQAVAEVSPGAKLGATAPYAKAECVLLEVGQSQPRSLANAFLRPVEVRHPGDNLMSRSISAMAEYMQAMDKMYGHSGEKRFLAVNPVHSWPGEDQPLPLREAIEHSLDAVFGENR
ncbi:MAG TPA: type I-E CRISPR-associated protein Cas7/Cse4/CasC [Limnochordia bacterium]|nr:type I-E CRISPR-associated protein Cas7/Cse4/CasC [Limnochordia bacterium]